MIAQIVTNFCVMKHLNINTRNAWQILANSLLGAAVSPPSK